MAYNFARSLKNPTKNWLVVHRAIFYHVFNIRETTSIIDKTQFSCNTMITNFLNMCILSIKLRTLSIFFLVGRKIKSTFDPV